MDRNVDPDADTLTDDVALRKESVDRNVGGVNRAVNIVESLSARRAWIEMSICVFWTALNLPVALRKESVDRNAEDWLNAGSLSRSLSARRAWIEIFVPFDVIRPAIGRSPQGERG